MKNTSLSYLTLLLTLMVLPARAALADEGMWLFNHAPVDKIKETYGVTLTPDWLSHVQRSAVRLSTGGSGSLVSKTGLVLTNHHVASDMIAKLSTPERDLMSSGFFARSQDQELRCPDLEVLILWTIQDVTQRVKDAGTKGANEADANIARKKEIAAIESESLKATGMKSEVVTLYHGGRYHLYAYKRFTDVRLVFAPEASIAFFGGDTDNFEYPRFNLDCTLLRIYQDGKPLNPEHYLKVSTTGPGENEPVFVAGHPGHTQRQFTAEHFKYLRDFAVPSRLDRLHRSEVRATGFAGQSTEHARMIRDELLGIQNTRKVYTGLMSGLADPGVMAAKIESESKLRAALPTLAASDMPVSRAQFDAAASDLAKSLMHYRTFAPRHALIGEWPMRAGELLPRAMHMVRLADERSKPNDLRLLEYSDARTESFEQQLFSPATIYDQLEIYHLESYLQWLVEKLGGDDQTVKTMLDGKSPRERARQLVAGCTFKDPAARRALVEGGKDAIMSSTDPLIVLARTIDPEARNLRQRYENQIEAVERSSYAAISAARFTAFGESTYPDATFTLRLAYGKVLGYQQDGAAIPAHTTFKGLFDRYQQRKGQPGFDLPQSWLSAQSTLDPSTPFNFVCTCDIIGGNSGSPVVNASGQLVGLIFDGNIQSLVADLYYEPVYNRAVAVDIRGMLESLRKVYHADNLVDELTN